MDIKLFALFSVLAALAIEYPLALHVQGGVVKTKSSTAVHTIEKPLDTTVLQSEAAKTLADIDKAASHMNAAIQSAKESALKTLTTVSSLEYKATSGKTVTVTSEEMSDFQRQIEPICKMFMK